MRCIHHHDLLPSPWKNGLGQTWEIASDRSACAPDAFRWRLSRARITDTCRFSAYPGVRRWLVLAAGGALELRIDQAPPQMLEHIGDQLTFDGAAKVEAVPLDGPTEDFNLMLADSTLDANLLHRPLLGTMVLLREPGAVIAVHLLHGEAELQGESATHLSCADTLLIDGKQPGPGCCRLVGAGAVLIVRIFPRVLAQSDVA